MFTTQIFQSKVIKRYDLLPYLKLTWMWFKTQCSGATWQNVMLIRMSTLLNGWYNGGPMELMMVKSEWCHSAIRNINGRIKNPKVYGLAWKQENQFIIIVLGTYIQAECHQMFHLIWIMNRPQSDARWIRVQDRVDIHIIWPPEDLLMAIELNSLYAEPSVLKQRLEIFHQNSFTMRFIICVGMFKSTTTITPQHLAASESHYKV